MWNILHIRIIEVKAEPRKHARHIVCWTAFGIPHRFIETLNWESSGPIVYIAVHCAAIYGWWNFEYKVDNRAKYPRLRVQRRPEVDC